MNTVKEYEELMRDYKTAKKNIDRKVLLEVANSLDIYYKNDSTVIVDEKMLQKSGNNSKPKIINISKPIGNETLKKMVLEASEIARKLYTNNDNRCTIINNKDTNIKFEIGNLGIKKTFSKKVPIDKITTANKLLELGEESIYFKTTYDYSDSKGIIYHHFLAPVRLYNDENNHFVRMVIKEYTNRKDLNNKFYYHQIEYLKNEKEVSLPVVLQSNKKQAFESTSFINNSTDNE